MSRLHGGVYTYERRKNADGSTTVVWSDGGNSKLDTILSIGVCLLMLPIMALLFALAAPAVLFLVFLFLTF